MKRKFFSVVTAACAALFSFSGLTGCSGGSDSQDETYGIVTLDDFEYGNKGFAVVIGSTHMVIMPTDADSPPTELLGGSGKKDRDPYRTGTVVMKSCELQAGGRAPLSVKVTYHLEWTDKNAAPDVGAVAVGATPAGTYLVITFDDVDDVTSQGLFSSIGAGYDTVSMETALQIGVDFAGQACSSACVTTTLPGSEYKKVNLANPGSLFAQKRH